MITLEFVLTYLLVVGISFILGMGYEKHRRRKQLQTDFKDILDLIDKEMSQIAQTEEREDNE